MIAFSSGVIIRLRFSGPRHHAQAASSSSCLPMACFLLRAARMAAREQIGQVRPGEPGCLPGHDVEIDVVGERLLRGVERQDGATAVEVRASIATRRSKRPERSSAGSRTSGGWWRRSPPPRSRC